MRHPRSFRVLMVGGSIAMALAFAGCSGDAGSDDSSSSSGMVKSTTVEGVGTTEADPKLYEQLPEEIRSRGLRIVTSPPYPPYEFFEDKKTVGLDIDLGNAVAAKLGVEATWSDLANFDGVVPGVQAGKYDMTLAGISDNKERQQVMDMVDYDEAGVVWVVKVGNPENIQTYTDMCGKKVAIESGSSNKAIIEARQDKCAELGKDPVIIETLPQSANTLLAVKSGKVTGTMTNAITAPYVIGADKDNPTAEIVDDPEAPNGYPSLVGGKLNHSAIGVTKKFDGLGKLVHEAALALYEEGAYEKVFEKWEIAQYALKPPTLNDATS